MPKNKGLPHMAGKKISRANMSRIQSIADHAHAMGAKHPGMHDYQSPMKAAELSLNDQLTAVARAVYDGAPLMDGGCYVEETFDTYAIIGCYGAKDEVYYRADYSMSADGAVTLAARDNWVEVEEVWQAVKASALKAGALDYADDPYAVDVTVKALPDRTLELRVAWGWDNHKEQFVKGLTDFDLENYPTPPVAYYHGFDAKGKKSPKPIYLGKTIKREDRDDGHYLIVKLNRKPEADRVWEAALKGEAVVSPATAGHLRRAEPDGTLTYWPIVEISAWDYADSRKQAHPNSRAFPILKALYREAGIPLPDSIHTASDSAPETLGDSVSAGDQRAVDTNAVTQVIAEQMAQLRLAMRKGQTTL